MRVGFVLKCISCDSNKTLIRKVETLDTLEKFSRVYCNDCGIQNANHYKILEVLT